MGTPSELDAAASVRIKLRRALALTLTIAMISFVGSLNVSGRLFSTAPVAADAGGDTSADQSRGPGAAGGTTFSLDDFEAAIDGRYGGFDIAVLESRGLPDNSSGSPIVVVDVAVRNSTDRQIRLPESLFGLQTADGGHIPLHRFEYTEHSTRLVLEPGVITTATLVVRLPPLFEAYPDLYSLVIAEPYRVPLVLPISPDAPAEQTAGVATGVDVALESEPAAGMTIRQLAVTLNHRAYRARVEQHLVSVTADVAVGDGASADDVASAGWWRLVADGVEVPASLVELDETGSSTTTVTVVFETPTAADRLTLMTGSGDGRVEQTQLRVTAASNR